MKTTERLKALAESALKVQGPGFGSDADLATMVHYRNLSDPATIKELCELVEMMEAAIEAARRPDISHYDRLQLRDKALDRVAKFQRGE